MRRSASLVLPLLAALVVGCNGGDSAGNDGAANTAANLSATNQAQGTNSAANDSGNSATNSAGNAAGNEAGTTASTNPPATSGPAVGIVTTKSGTGVGAADGTLLSMRYTGKLKNGEVFDSNATGKPPFNLVLGSGQVIRGWEEGLQGIKEGERRTLNIPAVKGYGEQGSPPKIGPNEDLVFDVEAIAVIPVEKQETVRREILQEGKGAPATTNKRVTFHYVGKLLGGDEFDSSRKTGKPISITLGKGEVVRGMEAGLEGVKTGEKLRLTIPPASGYGMQGSPDGQIPPNSILVFDIEIVRVG